MEPDRLDRALSESADAPPVDIKETPVLAIMFADAVASTAFAERAGEVEAESRRKKQFQILREIVEADGRGKLLKSLGDGFMAAFPDPTRAVLRAIEIQRRMSSLELGAIRIGLHLGQVSHDNGLSEDLYGRQVNRAARVCGLGNAGQILVTLPVYDNASGWLTPDNSPVAGWHRHGRYSLKGVPEAIGIYEVLYEGHSRPQTPTRGRATLRQGNPLIVMPLDRVSQEFPDLPYLSIDELPFPREAILLDSPLLSIGRGPNNRLMIADIKISRYHAVIARIGASWVIVDHGSRNGTTVGGTEIHQHLLTNGDTIELGPRSYTFRSSGTGVTRAGGTLYAMAVSARATASQGPGPVMGDVFLTLPEETLSSIETYAPPRAVALTCCDGPGKGATHAFVSDTSFVLGQGTDVDLQLDDPELEDEHLIIGLAGSHTLSIQTVGDAAMPWINGQQAKSATVRPGDMISIGQSQLLVHLPL